MSLKEIRERHSAVPHRNQLPPSHKDRGELLALLDKTRDALAKRWNDIDDLRSTADHLAMALRETLAKYVDLANSGDCGNWDPEQEQHVICSREALASLASPTRERDDV